MIHVNRGATSLGTFSEEDVREGLSTGRFVSSDLGWREGMANWQPLSEFAEFGAAAPAPLPPHVGTTTSTTAPAGVGSTSETPVSRSGLPWEHRQDRGFFNAFIETLSMVLTKPGSAFSVMRTEGGFGEPLLYAIIGGAIGVIVWFIFSLCLHAIGFIGTGREAWSPILGMTVSGMFLIWRLVGIAVGPFIFGALVHLSLMLLGGAKKTFETTFRVIAFSQGSTMPLQLVPCCGWSISLVWWLVANCIGVARAHEIDAGKATLAVFLPVIVCCGGGILIAVLFGGAAVLSSHHWDQ
jgi:hypothetical protein